MKVKELISKLQEIEDENLLVYCNDRDYGYEEIESVSIINIEDYKRLYNSDRFNTNFVELS